MIVKKGSVEIKRSIYKLYINNEKEKFILYFEFAYQSFL